MNLMEFIEFLGENGKSWFYNISSYIVLVFFFDIKFLEIYFWFVMEMFKYVKFFFLLFCLCLILYIEEVFWILYLLDGI